MDEQSLGEKLSQCTDVQRILRRPINPAHFRPGRSARSLEPTCINLRHTTPGFSFSFQIRAMLHDQLIDASPQGREQFTFANVHPPQDRVIASYATNLVGNSDIGSEVSHPI